MKNYAKSLFGAALVASAAFASAQSIGVTVDGNPVKFGLQQPTSNGGRVLVPLRGVFEQMGATVMWDAANRMVLAQRGDTDVKLKIGSTQAEVDGQTVTLDSPAMIKNGATLVPLRFLSESLGASVDWKRETRMVAITTNGAPGDANYGNGGRAQPLQPSEDLVAAYTVIPIMLNNTLSSTESRRGDKFTARIDVDSGRYYGGIPEGTIIEGRVAEARPKRNSEPGVLDLTFDRMRLPDGRSVPFQGSLYSLDDNNVTRDADGVLIAKNKSKDNRIVYAGYGAGAGLLVGLLGGGKVKLENVLIGGVLGALVGQLEKPKANQPSDVTLKQGTKIGVRLDKEVALVQK
ncbi:copper amine oxidase N-terminal domain-containing protein [bacterium]|nr:MAG: copper amine oxidase N-terminal domain-containing protein [bacterium]